MCSFYIICLVLLFEFSSVNLSRIYLRNGNLEIQARENKNVSFITSGDGVVHINGVNLLTSAKLAANLSTNINSYKRVAFIAHHRMNTINDAIYGPTGILQKIKLIEGGASLPNSTSSTTYLDLMPRIRRLTRRVTAVQRRITKLLLLLRNNECNSAPCKNGGTCQDLFDNYFCICPKNWEGPNCDADVNECAIFAGTDLGCQNGATCINKQGGYECHCPQGFYGLHCTQRTLDCNAASTEICGHGTCINQKNGIKCICDQGWTTDGTNAACSVDVNECALDRPKCSVSPPVACINVPGSFYCGPCPTGYSGNGYYCADVNECATSNGGCSTNPLVQCINTPGSRMCGSCPPGYMGNGESCTYQGNVCAVNNGGCHPSATCKANSHISLTFVQCVCPSGFTGNGIGPNGCTPSTETRNSCSSNPCVHGTCQTNVFGYSCVCNMNYTGRNCDIPRQNPCLTNPCQNGGTCKILIYNYYCLCPSGYRGLNCQIQSYQACGGRYEGENGSIKFPTTNSTELQFFVSCSWYIRTNLTSALNITFKRFNIGKANDCTRNWLQLNDGNGLKSPKIDRFCGQTLPRNGSLLTMTHQVHIWLRLFGPTSDSAFELSWKAVKPICEEFINVTSHGILKSPGSPNLYPNNRDCFWFLRVPYGNRIQFHFFSLEIGNNKNCDKDYIAFKQTEPPHSLLAQYCNTSTPEPFTSPDSEVTVHFHTDASEAYQGFQISYSIVSAIPGCGGTFTKSKGLLQSPTSLNNYDISDIYCGYDIKLNPNARVKLTFLSMKFKSSTNCAMESLTVFEKRSDESLLIGKYCEETLPASISSNSNEVYVVFQTKRNDDEAGFLLSYEAICGGVFNDPSGLIKPLLFTDNCVYEIVVRSGRTISLTMLPDEDENSTKILNYCDYIQIRDGFNENATLINDFCKSPLSTVVSTYNHVVMIFKNLKDRSILFNYTSIDIGCGGVLRDMKGTVSSPEFNQHTKTKRYCNWVLLAPPDYVIKLSWLQFHVENSYQCMFDYVEIFDNNTMGNYGGSLGKFCGTTVPPMVMSTSNIMTIRYFMDESITMDGITFSYMFMHENNVCGGTYFSNSGVIKSPGFPSKYPPNVECIWTITVNKGQQVRLNVTKFEIEAQHQCTYDYLEIRSGTTSYSPLLGKYCGREIPNIIPAHSNQIYLKFKSDISQTEAGFKIIWDATSTGCGGTLTSRRGSIISPYYPEPYHTNALCEWKLITNAGSKVNIFITDLDLEAHNQCRHDYIEIYDGLDRTAKRIGRYCSQNAYPPLISSNSSKLRVIFRSDNSMQRRGFNLAYISSCNNTMSGFSGTIESPGFPNAIRERMYCEWTIQVSRGNKINITFSHYNLFKYGIVKDCRFSYIEILNFDPYEDDWRSYMKFCSNERPPQITVPNDLVKVRYHKMSLFSRASFRLEWSNYGCGGNLMHPEGTLTSPNFPEAYPDNTECVWIVNAGFGNTIEITFHQVFFERLGTCNADLISLYNGPDKDYPLLSKICEEVDSNTTFTSSSHIMTVIFESDSSYSGHGFNASYKFVNAKCGGTLKGRTGSLHSHNYPKNFDKDDVCEWLIVVQENYLINFTVTDIDFYNNENCTFTSYLKVYDGPTAAYPVLAKLCNKKQSVISTGNMLFVEMRTSYSSKGFMATYTTACGSRIETQSSGVIDFEKHLSYYDDWDCTFTIISQDPGKHVHATFTSMNIYYSCYDNITDIIVYDGETANDPVLGRYCGIKSPPKITSSGYALHIVTTSKNIFSLAYSVYDSTCGGTVESFEGSFSSVNYPNDYPPAMDCEWIIKASPGNKLSLSFSAFKLVDSDYCNEDYLEVREGTNNGKLLGTYCGEKMPSGIPAASGLWIYFKSTSKEKGETTAGGFLADYQYVTSNEITGTSGIITSPLYPKIFAQNEKISWQIMVRVSYKILLTFKDFDLDYSSEFCYSATLNVYDGPDEEHPSLGTLCGNKIPKAIKSSSNIIYIVLDNSQFSFGSKLMLEWQEIESSPLSPYPVKLKRGKKCGIKEVIDLSNIHVYNLTSPGYPNGYKSPLECEWIFNTTAKNHVEINFKDVALPESGSTINYMCLFESINVYTAVEDTTSWELLESVCLPNATKLAPISATNYMKVVFESTSNVNGSGFSATVYEVCGNNLTDPNGIISVSKPSSLDHVVECHWTITVKPGRSIEINFITYDLEKDEKGNCIDYVLLKNGINADSPVLGNGKYCGIIKNASVITTGRFAYIKYHSLRRNPLIISYKEVSTNCGGNLLVQQNNVVNISSPNYPNIPNPNSECFWTITAPPGESLLLDFVDRFDLTADCNEEYVEVRDGGTLNSPLIGRYCTSSKPSSITSKDNMLFVTFFTNAEEPRNGFKAQVSIAKCGGTIRGNEGRIYSPDYGHLPLHHKNIECIWHVIGPYDHALLFKFDHIDLPISRNCDEVHVEIYNVNNLDNYNSNSISSKNDSKISNLIGRYCGPTNVSYISSSNNEAIVKFAATDTEREITGFSLSFNMTQDVCGGKLTQPSGFIESPGYPTTRHYDRSCEWIIKVPKGRRIKYDLVDVDLDDGDGAVNQALVVSVGDDNLSNVLSYAADGRKATTIRTSDNIGHIYFWSHRVSSHRGFRLRFSSDEPTICVADFTQNEGIVKQPIENEAYSCEWERSTLHTNETFALTIESKYKKVPNADCTKPAIIGVSTPSKEIGNVCGTTKYPKLIRSPFPTTKISAILTSFWGPGNFTIKYRVHPCGGVVSGEGYLRSPNYPNKYGKNVDCTWLVKLPAEQRINVTTKFIDLGNNCDNNYITIYGGDTPKSPKIGTYCKKEQINFSSTNNNLWIDYHGDESTDGKGFELKYEPYVTVCQRVSESEKLLQSPLFPKDYPNNIECMWDILLDEGFHAGFQFERFQLEESANCVNDYLLFLQYEDDRWKTLGRFCGRNQPDYLNSTTNKVRVVFRTNDKIAGVGFRFTWTKNCGGNFVADHTKRYIISPGYPNNYENKLFCLYNITSSGFINIEFEDFDLEGNTACLFDSIRVYSSKMTPYRQKAAIKYCGSVLPGPLRKSESVIIEFVTDSWLTKRGFKFSYTSDDCGGAINQKEVKIISPTAINRFRGTYSYADQIDCMWNITAPDNKHVVVLFTMFELPVRHQCVIDQVAVYNDFSLNVTSRLALLCGNLTDSRPTIQSRGNKMLIHMKMSHYGSFEAYITYTYGPSIGCGGVVNLTKTETRILQVNSGYSMVDCHWEIFAPDSHMVKIEVETFVASDCQTNSSCSCQILEIKDGASSSGEPMAKLCTSIDAKKSYLTSNRYGWIRYALIQGNTNADNLKIKVSAIPSLCGSRNLVVSDKNQYITSPNYPNIYPDNIKCTWILESHKRIYLKFEDLDLNQNADNLEACESDRVEIAGKSFDAYSLNALGPETVFKGSVLALPLNIYRGTPISTAPHKFCGNLSSTFDYYTIGNFISITFYSGNQVHGKGFKMLYTIAGCNRNYTESQGRIFEHDPDGNCYININVPKNLTISIYFLNFHFIDSPACNSAGLEVKDLGTNRTLARLCGRSLPNPIFSFQNSVSIHVWSKQSTASVYDFLYTTTSEGRGCGGFLYNYFGRFSSPLFPGNYQKIGTCTWDIRVPAGLQVGLIFTTFDMPNDCATDYIEVTTYDDDQSNLHTFCGDSLPALLRSNNRISVKYVTSSSNAGSWVAYFAGITKNAKLVV